MLQEINTHTINTTEHATLITNPCFKSNGRVASALNLHLMSHLGIRKSKIRVNDENFMQLWLYNSTDIKNHICIWQN